MKFIVTVACPVFNFRNDDQILGASGKVLIVEPVFAICFLQTQARPSIIDSSHFYIPTGPTSVLTNRHTVHRAVHEGPSVCGFHGGAHEGALGVDVLISRSPKSSLN